MSLKHNLVFHVALQRPIVEFSLEDLKKLKMKEERQLRNKVCISLCDGYIFYIQIMKGFLHEWKITTCACFCRSLQEIGIKVERHLSPRQLEMEKDPGKMEMKHRPPHCRQERREV